MLQSTGPRVRGLQRPSVVGAHRLSFSEVCGVFPDPFQGPRVGFCLTLGNEWSEETHVLRKEETLLEKGTQVESRRVREPRRTALPRGLSLGFYGHGISFRVVFGQSF